MAGKPQQKECLTNFLTEMLAYFLTEMVSYSGHVAATRGLRIAAASYNG
jgi:hypothetical protein